MNVKINRFWWNLSVNTDKRLWKNSILSVKKFLWQYVEIETIPRKIISIQKSYILPWAKIILNNNYDGISSTDVCFIELNSLGYRISGALDLLVTHGEKLPISYIEAKIHSELYKDKFLVKSMGDYLILNLYKLIEIHDSVLGKILKENDEIELETCLEPSWKYIKNLKDEIGIFRNSIAHSKEQANNYVSFIDMDPNYLKTQTKIIIAANAAVFYISGIFENMTDLYSNSRISFNHKLSQITPWHPDEEIMKAKQEVIDLLSKTNGNLKNMGILNHIQWNTMKYN